MFRSVPTAKKIENAFNCGRAAAAAVRALLKGELDAGCILGGSDRYLRGTPESKRGDVLRACDRILETHGVEEFPEHLPNIRYLETGCMDAATLLFHGDAVYISTYSDERERLERRMKVRGDGNA